ncbi:14908_t:CDS:2, partial [Funneliformis mosseae]
NTPNYTCFKSDNKEAYFGCDSMILHEKEYKSATPEQVELTEKVLQFTADSIIAEKSKVIARLYNEIAFRYITIELNKVLQELIQKIEEEINCHNFYISL